MLVKPCFPGIDDDGRPNYTGLSLDTELQLAQFLVNSAHAFATLDPSQDLGNLNDCFRRVTQIPLKYFWVGY